MSAVKMVMGFINKIKNDKVGAFAAQTAFFTILSAVPFLMLLLSAVQFIPVTQSVLEEGITNYIPQGLQPIVVSIVQEIYSRSPALVSITAVVTIWISAKGIHALTDGMNSVYEIEESRPWILLRLRAAFSTLLFLAAIVILMLLVVFGTRLEAFLYENAPLLGQVLDIFMSNRVLIVLTLLTLVFDIFYVALPNRRATLVSQLPGAVSWMLFSFAFSIYVNYFNGLSMYGSLTTLVLIMMWLYFCMYFMLVCGAINFYFNFLFRKLRIRMRERRREKKNHE